MKPRTLVVSIALLIVAGFLLWAPLAWIGIGLGVTAVLKPSIVKQE